MVGIRDPELSEVVKRAWTKESDLTSLCNLGEFHLRKKLYINPSSNLAIAAVTTPSGPKDKRTKKVGTDEACQTPSLSVKTPAIPTSEDMEKAIEKVLEKRKAARPPRLPRDQILCHRCQKMGHYSRECRAPKPVPRENPTTENQ